VHNFFGGVHAPGNAGYAMKRTCMDNATLFHPEVVKTGLRHSYVDDILRSTVWDTAKIIVQQIFEMFEKGGFVLAKCVTNSPELLQLIAPDRQAKSMKELEFKQNDENGQSVLGVCWDVTDDTFIFKTREKERPMTRRGLLGHIAALFDPEGSIAPVTLPPKQILQKLTRQGVGWDDPLPEEDAVTIRKWLDSIPSLSSVKRDRCIVPKGFGKIVQSELHAMSDGSESGYGYVLLLQAALLSMRAIKFVVKEGDVKWDAIYQWSDSTAVLAMVRNRSKRFLPYCANRLQEIREIAAELNVQIRHVPGSMNTADICSRGLSVSQFLDQKQFHNGPEFLWCPGDEWPVCPALEELPNDHTELKQNATVLATEVKEESLMEFVKRHSNWTKLKVSTAWLLRFKLWAQETECGKHKELYTGPTGAITVSEIMNGELAIVTYVQRKAFHNEIGNLRNVGPRMKRTQLHNLHPFLDQLGALRVGGRLTESELSYNEKHQLILPRNHHLAQIIARSYHEAYLHAPPKTLLYLLRKRFWIVNGQRLCYQIERKCITCIKALGIPRDQIQGALPKGRVAIGNLWFQTGCDILGPVLIKIGRSQVKRYIMGLVSFTVKAVHFEILPDLTVQSFLNAMRRFIARRSRPQKLITDNAGTFSAGVREINDMQELYNSSGVEHYMRENEIEWVPNVPKASNRNGLFERPFRSLRRAMLNTLHGQVTTEDQLATVVTECEHLYNSRPLCANSDSPGDQLPITPNQIINPEPASAHPPGVFYERDLIVRNRYRQVQALVNSFWSRFRVEYLTSLQERTKSITKTRNFAKDDLVMLCDDMRIGHRGNYPLGVIVAVEPSESDNEVRKVSVKTATGVFKRPVNKICLLEAEEDREDYRCLQNDRNQDNRNEDR
jgi:hypothetical protein